MLCVAVVCAFCVESAIIAVDRVEHALGIEHDASPVAGTVVTCTATQNACDASGEPAHPVSHVHSGDTTTNGTLPAAVAWTPSNSAGPDFAAVDSRLDRGLGQGAPERPPKA